MNLRAIGAALAIGIVLAGAAVGSRWFDARPADAFVEPTDAVYLALDCDTVTAGVQDACAYPSGTTSVQVDVVLGNSTASSFELAAFDFGVIASPQAAADPPLGADGNLNANPDANEAALTPGTWMCTPPAPDNDLDPDPNVAQSILSCFNADGDGPLVAPGSTMKLATVRYDTIDGFAALAIGPSFGGGISIGDVDGNLLGECAGGVCPGATLTIGDGATLTPSATNTATPTLTPTATPFQPMKTPSGTPVGGVSDVVGLSNGMCVLGSIAFADVSNSVALSSCLILDRQQSLQTLVSCLRASDVDNDGEAFCGEGVEADGNGLLHPTASDFESIDYDADQIHAGQPFALIAFVDGDWPVLFEFETPGGPPPSEALGTAGLCYTDLEPDCDANPATVGDGVVVAILTPPSDITGGSAVLRVTQAGVSQALDVTLAGPPDHIELEVVEGKDTIRTGATSCDDLALPWDIGTLKDLSVSGVADEQKSVVIARVFDAFGHQLTSSLLNWTPPYEFDTPAGGGSLSQTFTMDLGAAGIGAVQVVCSKDEVGELESSVDVNGLLDPLANPEAVATVTIHVVDELPTATATASPTATDTAEPTETPPSTSTPVPTSTSTATATQTAAATVTAEGTARATQTVQATRTAEITRTVVATRTAGASETARPSETAMSTQTTVPTSTNTATATPTASPSATASSTSTTTPSASPTGTASSTPTATPTSVASATKTAVTRTVVVAVTAVRSATPFSTVLASRATPPAGVVLPDTGDGGSGGGGPGWPIVGAIVLATVLAIGATWRARARSR